MDADCVLAIDLGGTRLRVALVEGQGSVSAKEVIPTPKDDPSALARAIRSLAEKASQPIKCAVVGIPGPVDYSRGEVLMLPNLPGWEQHVSAQRLADEVRLPVLLANDADLAALGEHRYGAGRGTSDMVYVTSSTGVGAGVIIGGRLVHGQRSLAEVGHMIIERSTGRTVEELGSGTALSRAAGMDGAGATALAQAGDERALAVFAEVADAFAIGVYNLVHCFMPERVVIGGGVSQAGDLLLDPIRDRLRRCGPGCSAGGADVVLAHGGDDVGLLGAFAFWLESTVDVTGGGVASAKPPSHRVPADQEGS